MSVYKVQTSSRPPPFGHHCHMWRSPSPRCKQNTAFVIEPVGGCRLAQALMALMELQPGVYRIKRHVKGEFISIETISRPEPSSDIEDNAKESSGPMTGCTELCRGAAGRTLEFACGNLFDVTDIAQVSRNVSGFLAHGKALLWRLRDRSVDQRKEHRLLREAR